MEEYRKQIITYIITVIGVILLLVVCVVFNYFIVSQHKEAEQLRFKKQVEEVKKILDKSPKEETFF